jgi:hypothetical protein
LVVDEIKENVSSFLIWRGDCKIINLTFEDDSIVGDVAGVQAWFMGGRIKTKFTENAVGMLFLEAGQFWMTLHS